MTVSVDVQRISGEPGVPEDASIGQWISAALATQTERGDCEVTVRVVDQSESRQLNSEYRGKDKPTNVLSFPFEPLDGLPVGEDSCLGDLVICAPVVAREADEQGKQEHDHWAHMVIHGTLHLLGYDHQIDEQAATMESLEISILGTFGIEDPYTDTTQTG